MKIIRSLKHFFKRKFRIRRTSLFLKLFFYILFILIITEAAIFGFFQYFAGKKIMPVFIKHAVSSASMIREYVTEDKESSHSAQIAKLNKIGEIFNADVWITTGREEIEEKKCPIMTPLLQKRTEMEVNGIIIRRGSPRHAPFQISIPLNDKKDLYLHLAFRKRENQDHEFVFAAGLGIIGIMLALFIAPLAMFIVRPVTLLKESSMRIAEGDLTHRITLKRSDELGDAAKAFNLMADRVERMIYGSRELTANISHELRSPLTRIRLAEELLREKTDPALHPATARHLKTIQEEVELMDRLIGKILEFSKSDLRRENLRREDISLQSSISYHIRKNKELFYKKNITIHETAEYGAKELSIQDLSADHPVYTEFLININREDLDSIISNLIANAAAYTSAGGIVKSHIRKEQSRLVWVLSNSCEPFTQSDLKNIFEPFFHKRRNGNDGTGLGLAILKKLVERYDGKVSAAYSGGLISFTIELPLSS